jgi:hypothetical protein
MSNATPSTGRSTISSEFGPFAIIPEWVLLSDLSSPAMQLYGVLALYANAQRESFPARSTLAKKMRCSVKSVDRRIAELVEHGALTVEARYDDAGDRTSNRYTLRMSPPGGVKSDATGGDTVDAQNQTQVEPERTRSEDLVLRERPRNLPFDALADATGANPAASGGEIAKALAAIKTQLPADLQPDVPAGWFVAEIYRRADNYRSLYPDWALTPSALAKHWNRVGGRGGALGALDVAEDELRKMREAS